MLKPGGKAVFQEPIYHHGLIWTLRWLTPYDRTGDERPLSLSDIGQARKWFRLCGKRFALSVIVSLERWGGVLMVPARGGSLG